MISPLLANIYLHPLDVVLAAKGYRMVRYADDFVVLCKTADEAQAALTEVKNRVSLPMDMVGRVARGIDGFYRHRIGGANSVLAGLRRKAVVSVKIGR